MNSRINSYLKCTKYIRTSHIIIEKAIITANIGSYSRRPKTPAKLIVEGIVARIASLKRKDVFRIDNYQSIKNKRFHKYE